MVGGGSCRRNTAGRLKTTTFGRYLAGWTSPCDAERSTVPLGQIVEHYHLQDSLEGWRNVRKHGVAGNPLEGFPDLARDSHICPDPVLMTVLLQVRGWIRAPAWVPPTSRIYVYLMS